MTDLDRILFRLPIDNGITGISNAELDRLVELQPEACDPRYLCGRCRQWFRMPFGATPPFHCTHCGNLIAGIVRNWQ